METKVGSGGVRVQLRWVARTASSRSPTSRWRDSALGAQLCSRAVHATDLLRARVLRPRLPARRVRDRFLAPLPRRRVRRSPSPSWASSSSPSVLGSALVREPATQPGAPPPRRGHRGSGSLRRSPRPLRLAAGGDPGQGRLEGDRVPRREDPLDALQRVVRDQPLVGCRRVPRLSAFRAGRHAAGDLRRHLQRVPPRVLLGWEPPA